MKGYRGAKYRDLSHLSENSRIKIIGEAAERGLCAVFVDSKPPEKVERYLSKMQWRYPSVRLIDRTDDAIVVKTAGGPEGAILLQFGPRLSS